MNRHLRRIFVFCIIAMMLTGCKFQSAPAKTETTAAPKIPQSKNSIGYVKGDICALPILFADESDAGKLTPLPYESQGELASALLDGLVDAALLDPVLTLTLSPEKVGILSGAAFGGIAIVYHDKEVQHPWGMEGRYIAVASENSTEGFFLHTFSLKSKLDGRVYVISRKKIEMENALAEREIDGFVAGEPWVSSAVQRDNMGVMARAEKLPVCLLVTGNRKNTQKDVAISTTFKKAVEQIEAQPEKALALLMDTFKLNKPAAQTALKNIRFNDTLDSSKMNEMAAYLKVMGNTGIQDAEALVQRLMITPMKQ